MTEAGSSSSPKAPNPSGPVDGRARDLRTYARRTQQGLVAGAVVLLVVVGGTLIALLQGTPAAMGAFLCFAALLLPILLIILALKLIDWAARRTHGD